jgi:23S rRNA (adenine2503-C2)-methyltransferase
MTDIARSLREKLQRRAVAAAGGHCRQTVGRRHAQVSVRCRRWQCRRVGLHSREERGTLCISTQAGCALDCSFCSTGKQGFNRNLTVAEIIGQLWQARHALGAYPRGKLLAATGDQQRGADGHGRAAGQPRQHGDGLAPDARRQCLRPFAPPGDRVHLGSGAGDGSSARRVPGRAWRFPCTHANDRLRDELVPINRKYPLHALLAACQRYLEKAPRDFVTFEYVMLDWRQ